MRKMNKEIGKHAKCADTPIALNPLPMTYEPQEPSSRRAVPSKYDKLHKLKDNVTKAKRTKSPETSEKDRSSSPPTIYDENHIKVPSSLLDASPVIGDDQDIINELVSIENVFDADTGSQQVQDSGDLKKKKISSKKKAGVRKSVNLSGLIPINIILNYLLELKRYFQAAEEVAKELVEQNTISAENTNDDLDNGVLQLSKLGTLPLKSPKRLIALQLANNHPLFRFCLTLLTMLSLFFLNSKTENNLSKSFKNLLEF